MPGARRFKVRMRPGRAVLTATNDGTEAPSASSGEEVVVAEKVAAFLVRQRAADVIEVIEPADPDGEAEEGRCSGCVPARSGTRPSFPFVARSRVRCVTRFPSTTEIGRMPPPRS